MRGTKRPRAKASGVFSAASAYVWGAAFCLREPALLAAVFFLAFRLEAFLRVLACLTVLARFDCLDFFEAALAAAFLRPPAPAARGSRG